MLQNLRLARNPQLKRLCRKHTGQEQPARVQAAATTRLSPNSSTMTARGQDSAATNPKQSSHRPNQLAPTLSALAYALPSTKCAHAPCIACTSVSTSRKIDSTKPSHGSAPALQQPGRRATRAIACMLTVILMPLCGSMQGMHGIAIRPDATVQARKSWTTPWAVWPPVRLEAAQNRALEDQMPW